jgi:hypothetical protein
VIGLGTFAVFFSERKEEHHRSHTLSFVSILRFKIILVGMVFSNDTLAICYAMLFAMLFRRFGTSDPFKGTTHHYNEKHNLTEPGMKLLALESDDSLIETVLQVVDLPQVFPPLEHADFGTPYDAIDLYIKLRVDV